MARPISTAAAIANMAMLAVRGIRLRSNAVVGARKMARYGVCRASLCALCKSFACEQIISRYEAAKNAGLIVHSGIAVRFKKNQHASRSNPKTPRAANVPTSRKQRNVAEDGGAYRMRLADV